MAIDSYGAAVLWVLGSMCLSVLGLVYGRRLINVETLRQCHDVGGYLLSVVGTLYAVLLGLVVVYAMQSFQSAENICQQEANALADVYLLADHLPKVKQIEVKQLCSNYVNEVVDKEWNLMDDAKMSPIAHNYAIKLMKALNNYEPKTSNESIMYRTVLDKACQVWDNRRARSNIASFGIPFEEWLVLLTGAAVTIVFTYFFGLDNLRVQAAMTAMIALLISLNLLMVLWFGYPFSGDRKVHPDAFKVDQQVFLLDLASYQKDNSIN
jgi:hypothetical protein